MGRTRHYVPRVIRRTPRLPDHWFGFCLCVWLLVAAAPSSAVQTHVMDVATIVPDGSPWVEQLEAFKTYVETETDGRVKVNLRFSRMNERSSARRTAAGSMQAFYGSVAGISSIVRELNALEVPYLFDGFAEADAALDDPKVQKQVRKLLEKRKLVFGFWAENGFRAYFSRQPIRESSDMKGLRFRAQEAYAHVATYRAFGASPVTMDATNTLMSVQTGVVDGFDTTPIYAIASGWYQALEEGNRNLVLSRHFYQPGLMAYSKTWFDSLPKDVQRVLTSVPHDIVQQGRERIRSVEGVSIKNLKRYGYDVYDPTPAERAEFEAKQASVPDDVANRLGPKAKALLKAVRDAI